MEAAVAACPFKPAVNQYPTPSNEPHVPIRHRTQQVLQNKQDKINKLRESYGDGSYVRRRMHALGMSPSPNLIARRYLNSLDPKPNPTSPSRKSMENANRLHGEGARMKEKHILKAEAALKEEKEVATFKPNLCKGTEKTTSSYKNKPFLDRQREREEKERERRQKKEILEQEE
jgi:hypothetical protein